MTRKKVTTYVVTYSYEEDLEIATRKWEQQVMFDVEGKVDAESFRLALESVTHRHIDDIVIVNIFKL